jgi:hypothetical protein
VTVGVHCGCQRGVSKLLLDELDVLTHCNQNGRVRVSSIMTKELKIIETLKIIQRELNEDD